MTENISLCRNHDGDECERCGGIGYRKGCNRSDCIEHGCDGSGACLPDKYEIDAYKTRLKITSSRTGREAAIVLAKIYKLSAEDLK